MEKNDFKITANSYLEFKKFEALATLLPDSIKGQIDTIEPWFHGDAKIIFKKAFGDTHTVLPANLTHLSDTGNEIHVNTPDVLISIPYASGTKFKYSFVPVKLKKEEA